MTMVPSAESLLINHPHHDAYGDDCYSDNCVGLMRSRISGHDPCRKACLESETDLVVVGHMAENNSRNSSLNEAGSSSKDVQQERDEGWLQLGIGDYVTGRTDTKLVQVEPTTPRVGLVELDLLPPSGGGNCSSSSSSSSTQRVKPAVLADPLFHVSEFRVPPRPSSASGFMGTPLFFPRQRTTSLGFPQPEVPWGYRLNPWNPTPSSSSCSAMMLPGTYHARQFQQQPAMDAAGPSSDIIRVIEPPPRTPSGVWFVLQASQNQAKEPFLPQIPKSYLRIKDARMTVRLLIKYLVNKLRLEHESEVEITCRGRQLLPFMTLQHVRDNIWTSTSRDPLTLLPDSSTMDHLMILNYGRSA
ncbi:PREDICTED: uncharacterized protein LOC104592779 [Nelumbo nucifera]|uniref:Uncharacterized protein LOC104592779 n=2 Tax=Nelumbo nucifera TaxID=4432 RepID=A0A1U7ZQV7_NELNU|nr:PREDICTED: uncharacterized protein LOC104592779 [Nelumbo nucifera]DAD34121.1 TPA_asm: hypothetical protein HUJ06_004761 [Nelumbo nucifera]